ncbi:cysteine proteinase [Patellaria atrata CBS 101060]|uniref:Cysteine proteinase n=1 Tax=Patellaria atrata CBS 101060 TaxID=1346257 RepID=A0A9P4S842_9PEZI|nr:cysteine proteinase [Patellaria atrata CBS 101060]
MASTRPPTRAPSVAEETQQAYATPRPQRRQAKKQAPQKSIDEFWDKFTTKTPGKCFTILPDNLYARRAAANASKGVIPGQNAVASYEEAAAACRTKVEKIVKECRRINQKYRDPHFDIEADFKRWMQMGAPPDCLTTLDETRNSLRPMSVHRVEDIFERPSFFIEGATASDVRQGNDGDCWFMSALCTLSNKEGLIQKVCVARDEAVGVYGFVFHRDGEWISEVIDDKLYLIKEDFDDATLGRNQWLELQNRKSPVDEYRTVMQTGSRALYFAQCSDPNETWLPLLEKAYAKAHGDYSAIDGGFVGEGIEDLTGGVTTEVFATDILDKDKFWNEELMKVNQEFLFGCGQMGGKYGERQGIQENHAYSIMAAKEIDGERLLKLRNPWGKTEWKGPWSDGSEQWTPEWMRKLEHTFGDDGVFWISYKDLLRNYQHFDRTRLFGSEWIVTQQWTSLNVPWSVDYLESKFKITLLKPSPVVIVLSQLDERYWRGLEGEYEFHLQFRLHKEGEDDYIVRSNRAYYMRRSVSTELDLDAGNYTVLLKITAKRFQNAKIPEEMVRNTCNNRREKLLSIGLSYDLAHAKGQFRELERQTRAEEKRRKKEKKKAQIRKAYEARKKQHKKAKLRKVKENRKIDERIQRSANASGTATPAGNPLNGFQTPDTRSESAPVVLNRKLEEMKLQDQSFTNGLGIHVNGEESNADANKTEEFPRTQQSPGFSPNRFDSFPDSQRPSTPTQRPTSPRPVGGIRRSTSPAPLRPQRRATLSPLPGVRPGIEIHHTENTDRASIISNKPSLSDISSDDLSWDSEIDLPSSDSESSDEGGHPCSLPPLYGGFSGGRDPSERGKDKDEEEDEFERDPWNAVCVVGLRVYGKNTEVGVEVVRPGDKKLSRKLDVDDSAADATKALGGGEIFNGKGDAPRELERSKQG